VQSLPEPHFNRVRERSSATGPRKRSAKHRARKAGANPARALIFRGVAEQQMQRAVNAPP
jgi:hypothetical protein